MIGKPEPFIFDLIRKEHNLEKEPLSKFLMIGDNLSTDIKMGNNTKIDTLLVLSGNTTIKKAEALMNQTVKNEEYGIPTYISPYFSYS